MTDILPGLSRPLSPIVQGTMLFESLADEADVMRLLDGVLERGGSTFDTAHVYGGGENERIFGRWLQSRGVHDDILIVGKGGEPGLDRPRVTPFDLTADLHDSLTRMRVDHIDLYLVHVDDPSAPVAPLVEVLDGFIREGKIGAYGMSNWTASRIREALEVSRQEGWYPPAASSVSFSLAVQRELPWNGNLSISGEQARAEREFYLETGMPVLGWSTLAGGFFSGRFTRENLHTHQDYFDKVTARAYGSEDNFGRLDRARALGERHGLSAAQVALAWVVRQGLHLYPLVGSRTAEEYAQNLAAVQTPISYEELDWVAPPVASGEGAETA